MGVPSLSHTDWLNLRYSLVHNNIKVIGPGKETWTIIYINNEIYRQFLSHARTAAGHCHPSIVRHRMFLPYLRKMILLANLYTAPK